MSRFGVVRDPMHAGKLSVGNRETSTTSERNQIDPRRKKKPDADAHVMEESDRLVVPEKAANKVKAEESLEGRGWTKENT